MEKGKEISFSSCSEDFNKGKKPPVLIDRSKVRILLWDKETKSKDEISALLCSFSYTVNSVRSAAEVMEFLKAEGSNIDILLVEVRLPMGKNMKMLNHITRDKDLRHIAVMMLTNQAEISVAVKYLRVGAADYLTKPLRTNELLFLWTHMWRKRRTLRLPEKNIAVSDKIEFKSDIILTQDSNDDSIRSSIKEMSNMRIM